MARARRVDSITTERTLPRDWEEASRIDYNGHVYRSNPTNRSKRAPALEVGGDRKSVGRTSLVTGVVLVVAFGSMLLLYVGVLGFVALVFSSRSIPMTLSSALTWLAGPFVLLLLTLLGVVLIVGGRRTIASGRRAAEHMAWLRANGLRLPARVVNAAVPDIDGDSAWVVVGLDLQVMGPSAPYTASADKLVAPDQVDGIVGSELYVRANPQNLAEVIVDEG